MLLVVSSWSAASVDLGKDMTTGWRERGGRSTIEPPPRLSWASKGAPELPKIPSGCASTNPIQATSKSKQNKAVTKSNILC